jgi:outer membrane lipoprotein-sorting protein
VVPVALASQSGRQACLHRMQTLLSASAHGLRRLRRLTSTVSLLLLLSACGGLPKPQLSAADQIDADRVAAYLNSIPRFTARFIQYGSLGPDSGLISLDRPADHMRIDYDDPARRVMVVANGWVLIVDRSTGATTTMPLSRTPLGMLLTPHISLSGAVTVDSVVRPGGMIQVTLQRTAEPSQGSLTLTLADQPLRLIAVTITGAERQTLTMHLFDIDAVPALPGGLFEPPAPLPAG